MVWVYWYINTSVYHISIFLYFYILNLIMWLGYPLSYSSTGFIPLTSLLRSYFNNFVINTTVTALASCIVVAWLIYCCHDISTDLTPERRVYILFYLLYIAPHTTSFVNTTQYLVPRRHVLWQYIILSLTPPVGLYFHLSSTAMFPQLRPYPGRDSYPYSTIMHPVKSQQDKSI
jgi:hypothetical protein